jgi:hypothetical protein
LQGTLSRRADLRVAHRSRLSWVHLCVTTTTGTAIGSSSHPFRDQLPEPNSPLDGSVNGHGISFCFRRSEAPATSPPAPAAGAFLFRGSCTTHRQPILQNRPGRPVSSNGQGCTGTSLAVTGMGGPQERVMHGAVMAGLVPAIPIHRR